MRIESFKTIVYYKCSENILIKVSFGIISIVEIDQSVFFASPFSSMRSKAI